MDTLTIGISFILAVVPSAVLGWYLLRQRQSFPRRESARKTSASGRTGTSKCWLESSASFMNKEVSPECNWRTLAERLARAGRGKVRAQFPSTKEVGKRS